MPVLINIQPILLKPAAKVFPNRYTKIVKELERTLEGPVAQLLLKSFQDRTRGWSTPIQFRSRLRSSSRSLRLDTGPFGKNLRIWTFVTLGTRPHPIFPVRAKMLRFPTDYDPHTGTGDKYGGPGNYSGPFVFAAFVKKHPGNEAREFEKHIIRKQRLKIQFLLEKAVAKAVL